MGLPLSMENLHAPTVPSGPTSGPATDGTQTSGLTLAQLQARKDNLEAEIRALGGVLDSVCGTEGWQNPWLMIFSMAWI